MWYVRDELYAVLYVRVSCFVVRGCGVSRRYIDVCYCDMFSVVNVYIDHLKFCVVCIYDQKYVYCGECNVVSNECDESTLVPTISAYTRWNCLAITYDSKSRSTPILTVRCSFQRVFCLGSVRIVPMVKEEDC